MFIIGDKSEGYDVVKKRRKTEPWESRVWVLGWMARRDGHDTQREAINYCHARYRAHAVSGLKIHVRRRPRPRRS